MISGIIFQKLDVTHTIQHSYFLSTVNKGVNHVPAKVGSLGIG
jgi:hypothetical protein